MSHHHRPQHHTVRKSLNLESEFFLFILLAIFLNKVSAAIAPPVYRCDDQYSSRIICSDGSAPAVYDPRNTDQKKAQDHLIHGTQAEADMLEKLRLKSDLQIQRLSPLVTPWPTKDLLPDQDTADSHTLGPQHSYARRKNSNPYFTAKDGKAKAKKVPTKSTKKKTAANAATKP